jgi:hypothetical protein
VAADESAAAGDEGSLSCHTFTRQLRYKGDLVRLASDCIQFGLERFCDLHEDFSEIVR